MLRCDVREGFVGIFGAILLDLKWYVLVEAFPGHLSLLSLLGF